MMNVIERAHALSEHLREMTRHAGGYGPPPQPDTEHARAIVACYYALLDENERQREAIAALECGLPVQLLDTLPGLEMWRRQVLDDPSRRPLERIAALELTAAQCKATGEEAAYDELVADARAIAKQSTLRGIAA